MLSAIREKTQGVLATIVLSLVAIPFVLWGTHSYFDSGSNINIAKVNGAEISLNTYRQVLDQYSRANRDPSVLNSREFKMSVVENLIDQQLLVSNAVAQGYRIGNSRLDAIIRELPYFQNQGRFDSALYESLLRREGLSAAGFESRIRESSIIQQMANGYAESAIVARNDLKLFARLMLQERTIDYVIISPAKFLPRAGVSREDVESYYQSHADDFKTPEQVRVAYLRLVAGDLAGDYQPGEEELRAAYEVELARFTTPARRYASHILLELQPSADEGEVMAVERRIAELASRLRTGADFAQLAKKHSQDPVTAPRGGDLGEVQPGMLPREVERALNGLKPGGVSAPVRSRYGFHLVKLTRYVPEKRRPFSAVRSELAEILKKRRGEDRFFDLAEQLGNLAYEQPDSLAPIAGELGLEIQHTGWFSRTGGQGIAANRKVIDAAFSDEVLGERRNSEAIELASDELVVIRVAEHKPSAPRPLKDVYASIETLLKQSQSRERAMKLGKEILDKMNAGTGLKVLAARHGLKLQSPPAFTRDRAMSLNAQLARAVFSAGKPSADKPVPGGVALADGGYAVFSLKSVRESDLQQADAALRGNIESLLKQRRGAGYFSNHRAALKARADIKIYTDKL